jgi:hypothetical protein
MAVTLNDLAKQAATPLGKAIIEDLLRQSKILQLAPIESVNGLRINHARWSVLPSIATRAVNGAYTESTGTTEQVQETLHIYGGEIKVDRVLELDKTAVESPMTTQAKMKTASLAYKFNYDVIAGDHAVDPNQMEGLAKRVTNLPARMTINLESAGDTLKVLASAANENTFLDGVHELIHKTQANCLLMNEATYLGFGQVLRRLSLNNTQKDNYDRIWEMFGGAKLVDVGLQSDQSSEIISSSEVAGDAGTDSTSIYGVRFDGEDGLRVIQLAGTSPEPVDFGELQTQPQKMKRIDWAIGLQVIGKFAVGRLKGFKMAAS